MCSAERCLATLRVDECPAHSLLSLFASLPHFSLQSGTGPVHEHFMYLWLYFPANCIRTWAGPIQACLYFFFLFVGFSAYMAERFLYWVVSYQFCCLFISFNLLITLN